MNQVLNILLLSLIAGLATGIGGLVVVFRRPGKKTLGLMMGLAAGVMITLSFTQLLPEAIHTGGFYTALIGFILGSAFMFLIDEFFPHQHFAVKEKGIINPKLFRTGMLIMIGILIHNIPEGIAVGAGYLHMPKFGILIAIAIALHNIPEGIATVVPLCAAGCSRLKAFKLALLSGLAEPVGAVVAALFLKNFIGLIPGALAFAAGVMIFITLDELVPIAHEHGHAHMISLGTLIGIVLMLSVSHFFGV